ncbi:hypothetical protein Lal_00031937 [Lupinus albus]|nr:hypothetical protein Lal_00031937 [Lupinus albus]
MKHGKKELGSSPVMERPVSPLIATHGLKKMDRSDLKFPRVAIRGLTGLSITGEEPNSVKRLLPTTIQRFLLYSYCITCNPHVLSLLI